MWAVLRLTLLTAATTLLDLLEQSALFAFQYVFKINSREGAIANSVPRVHGCKRALRLLVFQSQCGRWAEVHSSSLQIYLYYIIIYVKPQNCKVFLHTKDFTTSRDVHRDWRSQFNVIKQKPQPVQETVKPNTDFFIQLNSTEFAFIALP